MADKPTKGQALRNALDEIDTHYDKPKALGGTERSIEERKAAAMKKLDEAKGGSDSEDAIAKAEIISRSTQDRIEPVTNDIKTIGSAVKSAGDAAKSAKDAYSSIKSKFSADAGTRGAKSLIGKAAKNLFEFPVFVSSSVPLEYATAVNSLLEQMYAAFLQMAVSINPVVTKREVASGKVFQNLKTDITKFVEYAEYDWQKEACHNVITTDDSILEFNMIDLSAMESKILLEAANYEPLAEFDHYFQEASIAGRRHATKYTQSLKDREEREKNADLRSKQHDKDTHREQEDKHRKATEDEVDRQTKRARDAEKHEWERAKAINDSQMAAQRYQINEKDEERAKKREAREEAEEKFRVKERQADMITFNNSREKHAVDMKVKAPQMLDESKIQKLNTMKPLMMQVGIKVMDDKGSVSDMIDYVVGVRTHCRIVKADVLPDVAEYPLKEMSTLTRKAKWRAGEIKFLDFLFAHKEKKQAAYDSRDVNRKWYHRLYTLAHSKGSRSLAEKITGKSASGGLIPNATIVMTKADVDMIEAEKGIDLLKGGTARSFCNELFLMSLIVVDIDAQSIKILLPDINNDYEVQSLASVQKQIATLDTSGTVSGEVAKMMAGR